MEISQHLLLLCFLMTSFHLANGAKFQLAYKDSKSNNVQEYKPPIQKTSKIQCATHCWQTSDCDGFSLDSVGTCSLLKGQIIPRGCPGNDCTDAEGYSVYQILARY